MTTQLKEVPEGFIKMNLKLCFTKDKCAIIEKQVLKMLVRDFYILYTKEKSFPKGKLWYDFEFYCQEGKQEQIAYNFGIYAQTLFKFQSDKRIFNAIHSVPTGFPKCIRIKTSTSKKTIA